MPPINDDSNLDNDDGLEIDVSDTSKKSGKPSVEEQLAATNARLEEERALRLKAEGKAEGVRETLEAVGDRVTETAPDPKPKTRYTRQQLVAAVEANSISAADADLIYENQLREDITAEVTRTVTNQVSSKDAVRVIESQIDEYTKHFPNATVAGSKEHQALQKEYQELRKLGHPKGIATELMAAKVVFGPLERVKAGKEITREVHDGFQEGSGGSGNSRPRNKEEGGGEGKVTLSGREKAYYQKMIDQGVYKDFKEVGTMLASHSNPRIRERARQLS